MDAFEAESSFKRLIASVFAATGTYKKQLISSLVFGFLGSLFKGFFYLCFVPMFVSLMHFDMGGVTTWAIYMSVCFLLSSGFVWFSLAFDQDGYSTLAGYELRKRLGEHLRRVPLQYLSKKRTGEITSTLGSAVDESLLFTQSIGMMLIDAVVTPLTVAIGVFLYSWVLGVTMILIFPIIIPIYVYVMPILSQSTQERRLALERLNAETVEFTQGLAVLKSAGCVGEKSARFNSVVQEVEDVQKMAMKRQTLPTVIVGSVVEFGLLATSAVGIWLVTKEDVELAIVAGLLVAIIHFAEPLTNFLSMFSIFEVATKSFARLQDFLNVKPLQMIEPTRVPEHFDIELSDVSFKYESAKNYNLNELSLTLGENQLTALVGPSGGGKTTVTRMFTRYDDPAKGSVKIGGVDVRQIPMESLNKLVSTVFQDVYLFDDTIFNNIRLGRSDATDEEVYQAAREANCHDFIERLSDGYQTRLGDIGSNLSGGEKQRISIARALLKDAPIVILDEPTAALDTESELAVQKAIDSLVKNKTVVVIAHRLSTIVAADKIAVIEDGRVSESGSHDELLAENGRYAALWHAQHRQMKEELAD